MYDMRSEGQRVSEFAAILYRNGVMSVWPKDICNILLNSTNTCLTHVLKTYLRIIL